MAKKCITCGGEETRCGGETEGKSPLEKSRNRWEDNSEVDLKQLGWERED